MSAHHSLNQRSYGKLIGLTGGIASGKSTVSQLLKEQGAYIVDADQVARDIVQIGQPAWQDIKQQWGTTVLQENQQLDRKKLADLVFKTPSHRKLLEKITHPRIAQESAARIQSAHQQANKMQKKTLIVYDAALLIESKRYELFRPIVLVTCDPEIQIQRIVQRDHLTQEQAKQRINAQMSLQDKISVADHIIYNNGSLESLAQQVRLLWEDLIV